MLTPSCVKSFICYKMVEHFSTGQLQWEVLSPFRICKHFIHAHSITAFRKFDKISVGTKLKTFLFLKCYHNSGGTIELRQLGFDKGSSQITGYLKQNRKEVEEHTETPLAEKNKKGKGFNYSLQ